MEFKTISLVISLFCWFVFVLFWLAQMRNTKKTIQLQPTGKRFSYWIWQILGFVFLFSRFNQVYIFKVNLVPYSVVFLSLAILFSVFGICFAIWARSTLADNWSASVTLKQDHKLVVNGPYAIVRHPIYTSMLSLSLGVAISIGTILQVLGILLFIVSILIKLRQEEVLMLKTFGQDYVEYSKKTKRLIPFVY